MSMSEHPPPPLPIGGDPALRRAKRTAAASITSGIISLFFGISVPIPILGLVSATLALPAGLAAVITGHYGYVAAKRIGLTHGPAVLGLLFGYVTLGIIATTTFFWTYSLVVAPGRH